MTCWRPWSTGRWRPGAGGSRWLGEVPRRRAASAEVGASAGRGGRDAEDRVLVTKDGDFLGSHRLRASPRRLLIVTTGNIGNDELLGLFGAHLALLVSTLSSASVVELGPDSVVVFEEPPP